MPYINLDHLETQEIFPGFHGKMIHTDNMTVAYWDIDEGCDLPEHSHIHEQVVNVLEGQLELIVGGDKHVLGHGDVYVIPSNVVHSGRAISDCKVIDIFQPVREDYRK